MIASRARRDMAHRSREGTGYNISAQGKIVTPKLTYHVTIDYYVTIEVIWVMEKLSLC
jgi:hypothetical protein